MIEPKITIITPVKNSGSKLVKAIDSIFSQNYQNIENIIIDSNSTDNTYQVIQDLLNKYGNKIKYIRESDNSVAEGMNKGMQYATGDLIGCLNADDVYVADAFKILSECFFEYPNHVLHGSMKIIVNSKFSYIQDAPENPNFKIGQVINHPSTFIPRTIYNKCGGYDPMFKICGDWDLFIKYKNVNNVKFKKIDNVLTEYQVGGLSTVKPLLIFNEMHLIRKRYHLNNLIDYRYYRDYALYLIFRKNTIYYSYLKRYLKSRVKDFLCN